MPIYDIPFPNYEGSKKPGNIKSINDAERLLNYAGPSFIEKHVPQMVKIQIGPKIDQAIKYAFPPRFGAKKYQKLIIDLWDEIPQDAKRRFAAIQIIQALEYTTQCVDALHLIGELTQTQCSQLKDHLFTRTVKYKAVSNVLAKIAS